MKYVWHERFSRVDAVQDTRSSVAIADAGKEGVMFTRFAPPNLDQITDDLRARLASIANDIVQRQPRSGDGDQNLLIAIFKNGCEDTRYALEIPVAREAI
jgi:hypothetical protein